MGVWPSEGCTLWRRSSAQGCNFKSRVRRRGRRRRDRLGCVGRGCGGGLRIRGARGWVSGGQLRGRRAFRVERERCEAVGNGGFECRDARNEFRNGRFQLLHPPTIPLSPRESREGALTDALRSECETGANHGLWSAVERVSTCLNKSTLASGLWGSPCTLHQPRSTGAALLGLVGIVLRFRRRRLRAGCRFRETCQEGRA